MLSKLLKINKYLEGKKRNIAVLLMWLLKGITLIFPNLLSEELHSWFKDGIDFLLTYGTLDAARRSSTVKNIKNKIKNNE